MKELGWIVGQAAVLPLMRGSTAPEVLHSSVSPKTFLDSHLEFFSVEA
jgi:hypothetical protein